MKVVSWARIKLVVICFWDNHCVHAYPVHVIGSLFLAIKVYFTGIGGETGVGREQKSGSDRSIVPLKLGSVQLQVSMIIAGTVVIK